VGSVRVSLDDKATWQDVKFSDNGTFEYSFKPETGKTYPMLLEVTDTAGKTNKVDDTRKEISLSEENIRAKTQETLDAMFDAYNKENLQKFMGYVGEDFAGDKGILERAVKRDFDALSSINLRYTLNTISSAAQGRVFVSVTYNRMVFVNKTGQTSSDTGSTEFVFDSKEGKLSLFSMKQPLMFGLSDADNVATGSVLGGNNTPLVIDDGGNLGGGRLVTISCSSGQTPAYEFANGATACAPGGGMNIWFYVNSNPDLIGLVTTQTQTFTEPLSSLSSTQVKNLAGYSPNPSLPDAGSGASYCFAYGGTDFYCLQMVSAPTTANSSASFWLKKF
jgi:hypothetical protein